jgi:hypothetical protein
MVGPVFGVWVVLPGKNQQKLVIPGITEFWPLVINPAINNLVAQSCW